MREDPSYCAREGFFGAARGVIRNPSSEVLQKLNRGLTKEIDPDLIDNFIAARKHCFGRREEAKAVTHTAFRGRAGSVELVSYS